MADVEEVDILGDFDNDPSCSLITSEDDPELPSRSVQLLPEFSQHPWLLEQDWNLDHCSDEKSRAAIEKLLQEEQLYLEGHINKLDASSVKTKVDKGKPKPQEKPVAKRKSSWNKKEQQLFSEGLESYGRRWSKIAELIPSKTRQQVKNFALHHLKKTTKIPVSPLEEDPNKNVGYVDSVQKNIINLPTGTSHEQTAEVIVRMRRTSKSSSEDEEIDIELDSDTDTSTRLPITEASSISQKFVEQLTSDENLGIQSANVHVLAQSGQECNTTVVAELVDDQNYDVNNLLLDNKSDLQNTSSSTELCGTTSDDLDNSLHRKTLGMKENLGDTLEITADTSHCDFPGVCCSSVKQNIPADISSRLSIKPETRSCDMNSSASEAEYTSEPEGAFDKTDGSEDSCVVISPHPDEFGLFKSDGSIVYLANPAKEEIIDPQQYSSQEQFIFTEFFDGRPGMKNAERYLRIRNHILELWKKSKPTYLKKTAVRNGLRNCGDVNCIGRIHAYLEQIGAINFGCDQAQYNNPLKQPYPKMPKLKLTKQQKEAIVLARKESMRPRKRRAKTDLGDWVADREGTTITHNIDGSVSEEVITQKQSPGKRIPHTPYDPFKLVPCQGFSEVHEAPFLVSIHASAVVVMDIHCHLSKTEVIGLLGGEYDQAGGTLVITTAEPCDSLSTGMQCEMDPVSQTQACERILCGQQKVVGWYHSHPMFDANPSVRDMETQMEFQNWFAAGGNAFVGIIVSPFNRAKTSLYSDLTCLVVEKNSEENAYIPYKFEYTTTNVNCRTVMQKVESLAEKYVSYQKKVDLLSPFKTAGNITCLEKMMISIGGHCRSSAFMTDTILTYIRSACEDVFKRIYNQSAHF